MKIIYGFESGQVVFWAHIIFFEFENSSLDWKEIILTFRLEIGNEPVFCSYWAYCSLFCVKKVQIAWWHTKQNNKEHLKELTR